MYCWNRNLTLPTLDSSLRVNSQRGRSSCCQCDGNEFYGFETATSSSESIQQSSSRCFVGFGFSTSERWHQHGSLLQNGRWWPPEYGPQTSALTGFGWAEGDSVLCRSGRFSETQIHNHSKKNVCLTKRCLQILRWDQQYFCKEPQPWSFYMLLLTSY